MTKLARHALSVLTLLAACSSPPVDLGNAGAELMHGADASTKADEHTAAPLQSTQPPSLHAASCADNSDLNAQAQQQCDALGLPRIASAFFGGSCGMYRSTSTTFLCAQELPADIICNTSYVGSDETCVGHAALLAKARALCTDAAVDFADILFDDTCGAEAAHWAQFEYCAPIGPTLQDPSECPHGGVDSDECVDPSTLVMMAAKECQAMGQALVSSGFGPACTSANDTARSLKYECCPNSF
jgi:hypothetical protein